jgi:hypothetical protein
MWWRSGHWSGREQQLVVSGPLRHQWGVFRALLGLLPPPVGPCQILVVGEVQSRHRCGDDAPEDLTAPEDCVRLAVHGVVDSLPTPKLEQPNIFLICIVGFSTLVAGMLVGLFRLVHLCGRVEGI